MKLYGVLVAVAVGVVSQNGWAKDNKIKHVPPPPPIPTNWDIETDEGTIYQKDNDKPIPCVNAINDVLKKMAKAPIDQNGAYGFHDNKETSFNYNGTEQEFKRNREDYKKALAHNKEVCDEKHTLKEAESELANQEGHQHLQEIVNARAREDNAVENYNLEVEMSNISYEIDRCDKCSKDYIAELQKMRESRRLKLKGVGKTDPELQNALSARRVQIEQAEGKREECFKSKSALYKLRGKADFDICDMNVPECKMSKERRNEERDRLEEQKVQIELKLERASSYASDEESKRLRAASGIEKVEGQLNLLKGPTSFIQIRNARLSGDNFVNIMAPGKNEFDKVKVHIDTKTCKVEKHRDEMCEKYDKEKVYTYGGCPKVDAKLKPPAATQPQNPTGVKVKG